MPVNIAWDNAEKTIILMEYAGTWTWQELFAATTRSHEMMDEVNHPVDFIHHWMNGTHLPPNVLVHAKNLIEKRHPQVRVVVLIWSSTLIKAMWTAFNKLYAALTKRYTFLMATSLEEARTLLRELPAHEQPR